MNHSVWIAALALLAPSGAGETTSRDAPAEHPTHIEGAGPVTVIFEPGLGDTGEVWRRVQTSVADHCARTVTYTRRGYGTGVAGERDAEHIVQELRDLLQESGVSPPYVLVGHSLGGLYMQYFARRHPAEVRGLVLVDSMHRDQLDRVRAGTPGIYLMTNVLTYLQGGVVRREFTGITPTTVALSGLPRDRDLPTIVLSSTRPSAGETPAFRLLAASLQNEIASDYSARRHEFVPGSGHYIQRDQPQTVIAAARELAGCDFP